jgi:hypothetical protein
MIQSVPWREFSSGSHCVTRKNQNEAFLSVEIAMSFVDSYSLKSDHSVSHHDDDVLGPSHQSSSSLTFQAMSLLVYHFVTEFTL